MCSEGFHQKEQKKKHTIFEITYVFLIFLLWVPVSTYMLKSTDSADRLLLWYAITRRSAVGLCDFA